MHGRLHAAKSVLNDAVRQSSRERWDGGMQPLVQPLRRGLAAHDTLQLRLHHQSPAESSVRYIVRMTLLSPRRVRALQSQSGQDRILDMGWQHSLQSKPGTRRLSPLVKCSGHQFVWRQQLLQVAGGQYSETLSDRCLAVWATEQTDADFGQGREVGEALHRRHQLPVVPLSHALHRPTPPDLHYRRWFCAC